MKTINSTLSIKDLNNQFIADYFGVSIDIIIAAINNGAFTWGGYGNIYKRTS